MPKGLRRFHHTGDWHFITCSCYHRQKFLDSARRRDIFLDILEQVRTKYDFVVAGYVVMPKHFHLLMGEPPVQEVVVGDAGAKAACLAAVSRKEEKEREPDGALGRRLAASLSGSLAITISMCLPSGILREAALHP